MTDRRCPDCGYTEGHTEVCAGFARNDPDAAPTPPSTAPEPLTLPELAERRRYVESRAARDHWGAAELELIDREARWIATVDRLRDHLPDQEHNEQAIRILQAQLAQSLSALDEERRRGETYERLLAARPGLAAALTAEQQAHERTRADLIALTMELEAE